MCPTMRSAIESEMRENTQLMRPCCGMFLLRTWYFMYECSPSWTNSSIVPESSTGPILRVSAVMSRRPFSCEASFTAVTGAFSSCASICFAMASFIMSSET